MNAAARLERAPLPAAFLAAVERLIPAERRFDDPLSTLAFGTDASFYRLIPKLVVRVESEAEVIALLKLAHAENVPVTFRAAGTSLSGQAISDSVLIVLGDNWNGREIRNGGEQIRLQPGVIGANANAVKELVFAGALMFARNLFPAALYVRDLEAEVAGVQVRSLIGGV